MQRRASKTTSLRRESLRVVKAAQHVFRAIFIVSLQETRKRTALKMQSKIKANVILGSYRGLSDRLHALFALPRVRRSIDHLAF